MICKICGYQGTFQSFVFESNESETAFSIICPSCGYEYRKLDYGVKQFTPKTFDEIYDLGVHQGILDVLISILEYAMVLKPKQPNIAEIYSELTDYLYDKHNMDENIYNHEEKRRDEI